MKKTKFSFIGDMYAIYMLKILMIVIYIYFPFTTLDMLRPNLRAVSKYGLNKGKYGPEITPYLEFFHAVRISFNTERTRM